jgi:bla regulator protein BlaR1
LEQVELLKKLYTNEFGFNEANVNAVKNAIMLSDNNSVKVYGKTGTGKIGNADVNGWFIGYIETVDNTYVFAINIKNEKNANGQKAIEITTSIFERMGIKIDL